MDRATPVRLGGLAAIAGGLLRIVAAFDPIADARIREALYLTTDLLFLFGVVAIYGAFGARAGLAGLLAFALALAGVAIIVGTDGEMFGLGEYQLGSSMFGLGMAGLGAAFILRGVPINVASAMWIAALLLGAVSMAWPGQAVALFTTAGVVFGLGFATAGAVLLRKDV